MVIPPETRKEPKYLVLSGGGPKGAGLTGAMIVLDYWGYLSKIEGLACSSVGAIVGALWVLGYTPSELATICCEFKVSGMKSKLDLVQSMLTKGYGSDGEWLESELKKLISDRSDDEEITLAQLYERSGKHLVITTVCKTDGTLWYMDHLNHPKIPLYKALLMSSAVPVLFKPVEWEGKVFIDGGVLDNYPASFFPPEESIGIRLGLRNNRNSISSQIHEYKQSSKHNVLGTTFDIVDNVMSMINIMMDEMESLRIGVNPLFREICIDTASTSTFSFDIKPQEIMKLIASGMKSGLIFVIQDSAAAA